MRSARWIAAASFVLVAGASLVGQSGARNGEWRSYGGDLGHTRYAPLDQINATNFNKLEVAWRFKTDTLGPRPEYQFESTPLMAKGVLYSTAGIAARRRRARRGDRRDALDAQRERGRARRGRAASAVRPRARVLERRHRRSDPLRHARLSADRARRENRDARPELRPERRRRSEARRRSGDGSRHRRDRPAFHADRREERRDRRRRAQDRRHPEEPDAT